MTPPPIPGFRFLRPLGRGPLFDSWEARAADDVLPFVLKCLRPGMGDSATALALLRREERAGGLVRHPRVGKVVRGHVAHRPYYVLLELLPGESLADRLGRDGRLPVREAVWVARQAAEALAALHAAGLVHADVKPANVRLLPSGEAKLVDLSFAHRPGENAALHADGPILGAAHYLAPELCRWPPDDGPAADVFALGVVLFQALSGGMPFLAGSADDVIRARRTDRPRTLPDVPGRWPGAVVEAVNAMLAADPRGRPTAKRVVRDLSAVEVDLLRSRTG